MSDTGKKSYGEILKSSALIGGSAAMVMGFGAIRNKAMSVLLGTTGYGFFGMYITIAELARTFAGLGINSSGVRQIAEAVGTGDAQRIARTVTTLRRVALYSGAVGALLLVILCRPVSQWAFFDSTHGWAIALLALVAFCGDISAAQLALVQGMRKIADLARMNILGALYGTVFGILIVYFWKEQGLVPSLICVAVMTMLTSWWYARKIKVEKVHTTINDIVSEASALVKLGLIFMVSALATQGSAFLVRLIIARELSVPDMGLYHAAWTLGGMYIGFIIQAMGTDFYPRLTGAASRPAECNRLVNEQAEVGLLMAGPGIMGTMALAPIVITFFNSAAFLEATVILRWLCLGMLLRVIAWPMGFIVLAKGERKIFFWSEVLSAVGYVAFVAVGIKLFGLAGTGIAFFALYLINCFANYFIARHLTGFSWSPANRKLWFLFGPMVAAVLLLGYFKGIGPLIIGTAISIVAGIYSLTALCKLMSTERLPGPLRKIFKLLKLAPWDSDVPPSSDTTSRKGDVPSSANTNVL
jgi:PST family polysaccharide transporter